MKTIIKIALLTLGFLIIIGLFSMLFAKTEDKGSEELCHTFNAIKVRGGEKVETAQLFGLVPQACQVQEIDDIPSGKYSTDKQGAMKQIADLSARCWWMFLEGVEGKDVLGNAAFENKQCFICYTFDLDRGIEIGPAELEDFFDSRAYTVRDTSDKCDAFGGGQCMAECSGDFNREVESKKCGVGEVCCTAKDECVNKGGKCLDSCSGEFSQQYDGWACSAKRCCVDPDDYYTYRDYIQEFVGPGYLAVAKDFGWLTPEGTYAVFFEEEVDSIQDYVPGYGGDKKADAIIIDELNAVQKRCAIQGSAVS